MQVSSSWPRPREVWDYWEKQQSALRVLANAWDEAMKPGASTSSVPDALAPFLAMSESEFRSSLAQIKDELKHHVCLALLASFEAALRIDMEQRVRHRKKDKLSLGLRKLTRSRPGHGPAVEVDRILECWKKNLGGKGREPVGRLKQYFTDMRHWLAHGRYWRRPSALPVDPGTVWEVGRDALLLMTPGLVS